MLRGPRLGCLFIRLVIGTLLIFMLEQTQQYNKLAASKPSECVVYAAGPYGFTKSTEMFMKEHYYKAILNAKCKVLDPWRHDPKNYSSKMALGQLNAEDIRNSNGIVAALEGPDVDSGTAAEIGYAAALKKWVIGYREDIRQTGEGGDAQINLQVQYFIEDKTMGRGKIVNNLTDLTKEICIKTGRQFINSIPPTCSKR